MTKRRQGVASEIITSSPYKKKTAKKERKEEEIKKKRRESCRKKCKGRREEEKCYSYSYSEKMKDQFKKKQTFKRENLSTCKQVTTRLFENSRNLEETPELKRDCMSMNICVSNNRIISMGMSEQESE